MFNRKTLAIVERKLSDGVKSAQEASVALSPFFTCALGVVLAAGMVNTLVDRDGNTKAKIELARGELDKRGVDKKDLAAFKYSPWKAPLGANQATLSNMNRLNFSYAPKSRAEDSMSYVKALPYLTPTQVSKQVGFFWR